MQANIKIYINKTIKIKIYRKYFPIIKKTKEFNCYKKNRNL